MEKIHFSIPFANWAKKIPTFCWKLLGGFVKFCILHVARNFLRKTFFVEKFSNIQYFRVLYKISSAFWQNSSSGYRHCFLLVPRNNLRSFFLRKSSFVHQFRTLSKKSFSFLWKIFRQSRQIAFYEFTGILWGKLVFLEKWCFFINLDLEQKIFGLQVKVLARLSKRVYGNFLRTVFEKVTFLHHLRKMSNKVPTFWRKFFARFVKIAFHESTFILWGGAFLLQSSCFFIIFDIERKIVGLLAKCRQFVESAFNWCLKQILWIWLLVIYS